MPTRTQRNNGGPSRGAGPALDAMLTDAVMGPSRRWVPGVAGIKAVAKLATRPRTVARGGAGLFGRGALHPR